MIEITTSLVKELRERTNVGIMECKKALILSNGDIELAIDNLRKSGQVKATKKSSNLTTAGIILSEVVGNIGVLVELNCETDFVTREKEFLSFGREVITVAITEQINDINVLKERFENKRTLLVAKIGENINIRRVAILMDGNKVGAYLHNSRIGVLVSTIGANENLIKHIAMHIAASKPEYINPEDVPSNIFDREYQIQLGIAMQSGKSYEITEKIIQNRLNKFLSEISLTEQYFIMDLSKTVGQLLKEKNAKVVRFIRFEMGEEIKKREK